MRLASFSVVLMRLTTAAGALRPHDGSMKDTDLPSEAHRVLMIMAAVVLRPMMACHHAPEPDVAAAADCQATSVTVGQYHTLLRCARDCRWTWVPGTAVLCSK